MGEAQLWESNQENIFVQQLKHPDRGSIHSLSLQWISLSWCSPQELPWFQATPVLCKYHPSPQTTQLQCHDFPEGPQPYGAHALNHLTSKRATFHPSSNKGNLKSHLVPSCLPWLGHLPLKQVSPSPVQPDLNLLRCWWTAALVGYGWW